MTIIVKEDVILDECVFIAGGGGRLTRKNDRTVNQGGFASVNAVRDVTLDEYSFGAVAMPIEHWQEIEGVWEETDAGVYGFLIKDPKDQSVTVENGAMQGYLLGAQVGQPGFGNGGPLYALGQLKKSRSGSSAGFRTRTRPSGTPALYRGGTPITVGASPGNVSLSAGPVFVTFVPDSSSNVNSITPGATTSVTLAGALSGLVNGGRLWLQDLTGADAALLNNLSHSITNIVGSTYTLATNTAGKTITPAGTGKKYPQPDEALTWAGSFYVPVQFATDELDWSMVRGGDFEDREVDGPSIVMIEVREAP